MNGAEKTLAVAVFQHVQDKVPLRETQTWGDLAARLTTHHERRDRGGTLWSPTEYPPNVTRLAENVDRLSAIVFDMDSGIAPEAFLRLWEPYEFLIYSTFNSTPQAPRWRAVLPLATAVEAPRWPTVWRKLSLALTLGHIDGQCKDCSRIYWLPTCPVGSTTHFAFLHEGAWLDEADFPDPPAERPRTVNGSSVVREEGRVATTYLAARALEVMQREGRNAGAFWLACQMRDNGFSAAEAEHALLGEYLPRCPQTNAKGKVEPFTEIELSRAVRNAYGRSAREEWKGSSRPEAADPARLDEVRERVLGKAPADAEEAPPTDTEPEEPPLPASADPAGDEMELPATYTLADLQHKEIPPVQWIVPGLLCEGLNLLSGNPKLGKSFLSLGTAAALALGGKVLEGIDVEPSRVLYIAVEDGERRIKSRASQLLVDESQWPGNVHLAHRWPVMNAAGVLVLRKWFEQYSDTRLVIIDTWNGVRPPHKANGDIVSEDYALMSRLKEIGDEFHAAILIIHHTAQHTKGDSVHQAAGTHGLVAAPDTVINFTRKRSESEAELEVLPRDEQEHKWLLTRDERTGFWSLEGGVDEVRTSRNRLAIYDLLTANAWLRPKQIAAHLELSLPTVQSLCARMERDGELSNSEGRYSARKRPGRLEREFSW
jgi:hypothetical protein